MNLKRLLYILSVAAIILYSYDASAQSKGSKSSGKENAQIQNKKKEAGKLQEDINFLDRQLKQTQKKRQNTLNEIKLLRKKADTRKKLIDKLDEDINEQQQSILDKSAQLEDMATHLDTLKSQYRKMLIRAHRNRDSRQWVIYVIAGKNFEQSYRRWHYLKKYSESLRQQAGQIKEAQQVVEQERNELTLLKSENEKMQEQKKQEYEKLRQEEKTSREYANSLAKQQNKYKRELERKKKESGRLAKEIERMIAAAIAAEKKKAGSTASSGSTASASANSSKAGANTGSSTREYAKTPHSVKLSNSFQENKGNLPWPVTEGVIVESFGVNPHPTLKGVKLPFNNGINIAAPKGANVLSIFEGTVKQVIIIPGYSHCVLVSHGEYFTFYCKLGKVAVKAGQQIKRGQIVGTLDTSGSESELHFELWWGTVKQNPEHWLK